MSVALQVFLVGLWAVPGHFLQTHSSYFFGFVFCVFLASFITRAKVEKAWSRFQSSQRKGPSTTTTTIGKAWFRFQYGQRKGPTTTTTSLGTQTTLSMMPASLKYVHSASTAPMFVFGRGALVSDPDEKAKLRTALYNAQARITTLKGQVAQQTRELAQYRTWNSNARARIDQLEAEARLPAHQPCTREHVGQIHDYVWLVGAPRVNYGKYGWYPEPINRSEMEIYLDNNPRPIIGGRGGQMG